MNASVFDFCKATGIELTRSRAYKKNDQAWVEQKNGSVVRRLVGYGKLRGLEATETLASLYQVSRLYINFFQPSFKLKSKTRHGAKVTKRYEAPLTPLERVLRSPSIPETTKRSLRARFRRLDPLDLLHRIREAQQRAAQCSASGGLPAPATTATDVPLSDFLSSLGTAWQAGEIRPTHHRKARVPHDWRLGKIRSKIPGPRYWNGSKPSPTLQRSSYLSASPRWLPPCIPALSCAPCSAG